MSATRTLARLAAMRRRGARGGLVVRRRSGRAAFAALRLPDAMAPVDRRREEAIACNEGMRSTTLAH